MEPALEIDLRGQRCPMNFVRIKLALDSLAPGRVLVAVFDPGPVSAEVERSLIEQGYRVHDRRESAEQAWLVLSRP